MEFKNVTAQECNSSGQTDPQQQRTVMKISEDLIAAYIESKIFLKSGNRMKLGDTYYTDFQTYRMPTKAIK